MKWFVSLSIPNKVRIYKEYHSVCPLVRIGIRTPPPSPARDCVPPSVIKGWGTHRRTEKSRCTMCKKILLETIRYVMMPFFCLFLPVYTGLPSVPGVIKQFAAFVFLCYSLPVSSTGTNSSVYILNAMRFYT
jgi:hypothetical protein